MSTADKVDANVGAMTARHLDDFINLLAEISEEKQLKCAVKESLKGGLLTGCSAVIGGLLLGPVGLAIGGAVGGGISAISSQAKFQPVAVVLKNMNPVQRKKLYERFLLVFSGYGVQDVATLAMLILSQKSLTELAIKEVTNFLSSNMAIRVQ